MSTPEQPGAGSITPEQARAILMRDAANIVSRLKTGKTLSASERRHLQNISAGGSGGEPAFAANAVELARILNVERKTINRWRKLRGAPDPRPDGRYEVAAWRAFKATRRAGSRDGEIDPADEKARQISLQNEKLAVQVEILKRDYVRRVDVEATVSQMIVAAKRVLLGIPSALAPQVVGVAVAEAENLIRDAINEALAQLHRDPINAGEQTQQTEEGGSEGDTANGQDDVIGG